jgi:hypothetical protein
LARRVSRFFCAYLFVTYTIVVILAMRYKLPLEILEIDPGNFHLLLTSKFSSGENGVWVIDTGASKTVFDKNAITLIQSIAEETEDLHSASGGLAPVETQQAHLKPLSFGRLKIESLEVSLLDLNHINELYDKAASRKICGLLGGDFLHQHKAVIDYRRQRIILRD